MIHTFLSNLNPTIKLVIAIALLLISALSYGHNSAVSIYIGVVGMFVLTVALIQLVMIWFSD
ncbi:MAG: hypothetical protein V3V04_02555 [Rhizobiaceae bacterium]